MKQRHLISGLGFGAVLLAIFGFLRIYVFQELVSALILFSAGFAVIALVLLVLFLLNALGQMLSRKGVRLVPACTPVLRRWLASPEGARGLPAFHRGAEIAPIIRGREAKMEDEMKNGFSLMAKRRNTGRLA